MTVKVVVQFDGATLNFSGDGKDYESAKTAAEAQVPEGGLILHYMVER